MIKTISGEIVAQDHKQEPANPNNQNGTAASDDQDPKKEDVIRDNGPRIVGAIKIIPDILLFNSGLRDTGKAPFRAAAAVGFTASRLLLLAFGSKNRKKNPDQAESEYKDDASPVGMIKHNVYKVTHPNEYPVESGAGVAALAGLSVALSGAAQMRNKATFKEGVIELGVGAFTALAEGNVLVSQEAQQDSGADKAAQAGDDKDILQQLKNQPVLLSGITQAVASGSQIILGLMTLSRGRRESASGDGKRWHYLGAASIYTAADLIYAFFVRKNEFNTEAGKAERQSDADKNAPVDLMNRDADVRKLNWQQSVQESAAKDSTPALG